MVQAVSSPPHMDHLGGPTDEEATQAMLDLLNASTVDALEPDGYTVAPHMSSSPPALTPYDILQSLALLQQQDHGLRPSSASYHPQPTRSGRAPAPKTSNDAEDALPDSLDKYIEFPSDSESDDPDFQPRSNKKKGKRKVAEASSPSEEEDDEEYEGDFMIEEDEASGDDEVVKEASGRPMPPRATLVGGQLWTLKHKTPQKSPANKRVALGTAFAISPTSAAPPLAAASPASVGSPGSPNVKSYESVPLAKRAIRRPPHALPPVEVPDAVRRRRKAVVNKIAYERKKLDKLPANYPKSWERKYQELVVTNLELQKRNEELVYRLEVLGEVVEADHSSQTWQ